MDRKRTLPDQALLEKRNADEKPRLTNMLVGIFLLLSGVYLLAGAVHQGVLLYRMLIAGVPSGFLERYWHVYGGNLINALGSAASGAICLICFAKKGSGVMTAIAGGIGVLAYVLPAVGRFFFDGRWDVYGIYLPVPIVVLLCGIYRRRHDRHQSRPSIKSHAGCERQTGTFSPTH